MTSSRARMLWRLLPALVVAALCLTAAPAWASLEKPTVGEVKPDNAGVTSETLRAEINPNGADTTYRLEYGETSSYGSLAPAGPVDIGAGTSNVPVAIPLSGLKSATTYHYRLVAASSQGTTMTADGQFSTFGAASFTGSVTNTDGTPDVQAGSHPFQVTSVIKFTENTVEGKAVPAGAIKDLKLTLPTGLGGDPSAVPECPQSLLPAAGGELGLSQCPQDTQIGVVSLGINGLAEIGVPLYNLVPTAKSPAEFGVYALLFPLALGATLDPANNYALTVDLTNVSQLFPVEGITVTLWGVPADPSHDSLRGSCIEPLSGKSKGNCPSGGVPKPFLTLPGSCGAPLTFGLQIATWSQPGVFATSSATSEDAFGEKPAVVGCDKLDFSPTMTVRSDTNAADSPVGLDIDVGVPHEESSVGLSQASLKDVVVNLPAGMSINVSAADGLGSCTEAQVGLGSPQLASCPPNAAIGTAEIDTPLLPEPLTGSIYLAQPRESPLKGNLEAYVVAETEGVIIKLDARLVADPNTGQLTVTVKDVPQVSFTHIKLNFRGGPRGAIANPESCGSFPTSTQLTLYATSATAGLQPTLGSDMEVGSNCGRAFAPSFTAGTTSTSPGEETGFTLQVGREDGQPELHSISATLPNGLLAKLGSVPLCEEPHLTMSSCPGSLIGKATIAAGAGTHPFYLPANLYLTGPYEGAPFGLAILSTASAGPFDLGLVEIRARLQLDPHDAHLTISTDPIPRILGGIPLRVRTIAVDIDRHGFMFNPTSCLAGRRVGGEVLAPESVAHVWSPFNLAGCSHLRFAPSVSASTNASVSRRDGAAFNLKVREPAGVQASIRAIKVVFPSQLSARLGAIQHACLRSTFRSDPASCPRASRIGSAQAHTSLLAVPLAGPAYLVSDGRTASPKLVLLLQGQGVALELEGALIVAGKRTSAIAFRSLPDAPISDLEVHLPQGPDSALGANGLTKASGRLCAKKLVMRTSATGQNGLVVRRASRVRIGGCKAVRHEVLRHKARRPPRRG